MAKETHTEGLSSDRLTDIRSKVESGKLTSEDLQLLVQLIDLVSSLQAALASKKRGILALLRGLFGLKSEGRPKSPRKDGSDESEPKPPRGGRNGRNDYPEAETVKVPHPDHKPGDKCPECITGTLKEAKPSVDYDWQGSAPLTLTIYHLMRLVCTNCKTSFIAPSPVKDSAERVDKALGPIKATRVSLNATANAIVAMLRFWYGVPHYRLAKIQGRLGLALPDTTQCSMVVQVYQAAIPVYMALINAAAQGTDFCGDDTWIKILDWFSGNGPPRKDGKGNLKQAKTSVIISRDQGRPPIVLYLTSGRALGEEFSAILKKRDSDQGVCTYMVDAAACNNVEKDLRSQIIVANCMSHARRYFFKIESLFPKHCSPVLDKIDKIFKLDAITKDRSMTPEERQRYHREHSLPLISQIRSFLEEALANKEIEENADLGRAAGYFLKHINELSEFCFTPGIPLSNNESERILKAAICHRKNSLFYATEKGAHRGDVIQTIIACCEKAHVNPFKYLTFLQTHSSQVADAPEKCLPWIMKDQLS